MLNLKTEDSFVSDVSSFDKVAKLMDEAVEDGVFPGGVLVVGKAGEVLFKESFGSRTYKTAKNPELPPLSADTVFDIAGLTAGLVTSTLMMLLTENGRVRLDERVARYLQGFGVLGKSPITIAHLLSHTSGLPHWHPFFEELLKENGSSRMGILTSRGAKEYILTSILRSPLKGEVGAKHVYSDVGLILLGCLIEGTTGLPLDKAATRMIFHPLYMRSTSYIDLSCIRKGIHPVTDLIAPTEECSWRERVLCGEVHDDNAWALGGIAGHSGVFSTAQDIHQFAQEMIKVWDGQSSFMNAETLHAFLEGIMVSHYGQVKLGWDAPSKENGMSDLGFSEHTFGYNGFTGCSMWIDPVQKLDVVLMTNRIHPSRNNKKILTFRPELHRAILSAVTKL